MRTNSPATRRPPAARLSGESGTSLVEYAVVVAVVALASVTALEMTGDSVDTHFAENDDVYYDGFDAPVVEGAGPSSAPPPTTTAADATTSTSTAEVTTTTTSGTAGAHVSDIVVVASEQLGGRWNAAFTITVTNDAGNPVPGAVVAGTWTASNALGAPTGSPDCTAGTNGRCTATRSNLHQNTSSLTWTVSNITGVESVGTHAPSSAVADNPID